MPALQVVEELVFSQDSFQQCVVEENIDTTVAKSVVEDEARPPGIAKNSAKAVAPVAKLVKLGHQGLRSATTASVVAPTVAKLVFELSGVQGFRPGQGSTACC